jgi:hypothetical protein
MWARSLHQIRKNFKEYVRNFKIARSWNGLLFWVQLSPKKSRPQFDDLCNSLLHKMFYRIQNFIVFNLYDQVHAHFKIIFHDNGLTFAQIFLVP